MDLTIISIKPYLTMYIFRLSSEVQKPILGKLHRTLLATMTCRDKVMANLTLSNDWFPLLQSAGQADLAVVGLYWR
jgi:hypothetical protein